ncbi:MAG: 3-oxoacyl-ACP reductase FabG [Opitutales bacterium]
MDLQLNQRKALVTGAGRGIGRAIAEALAAEGAHVICVSRNENSCGEAAEAIRSAGGSAESRAVDVADGAAVEAAAADLLKQHECVDILVNNAGITRDGLLFRMSDDDWNAVLQTNLTSCFTWSKAIVRPMTRQRWGRVINITSVSGRAGNAGQTNYAAAKAGMIGFTMSLAREVASRSVTVNALAPGFIETDMTGALPADMQDTVKGNIPLKRFGQPGEIASLAAFLASERAGYITGQTFSVDGGMIMSA